MRYIKLRLVITLTACLSWSVNAKIHSPHGALEKLRDYTFGTTQVPVSSDLSLANIIYSGSTPSLYVYTPKNTDKGFVILSANDENDILVGYSPTGKVNPDSIPELLSFLISKKTAPTSTSYIKNATAIAPIITSKWHQASPYNNSVPQQNDEPCVVGCVGTAMSQLIRHHRYPLNPVGKASYFWATEMRNFEVDFSEYTFDYDNLLDDYLVGEPTEDQIKAVNDLMFCCSASVEANWSTSITTADSSKVPEKLTTNFNYSKDVARIDSQFFTIDEWTELLYSQLSKGLPVFISANKIGGSIGHAFICDGYDGNGFFHINWGWGGDLDGFYNIGSLYAFDPDVDYSTEGWGKNQYAIINIYPSDIQINPDVVCTANTYKISNITTETCEITCYFRDLNTTREVKYGIKLTDCNTGVSEYFEKGDKNYLNNYGWLQQLPENIEDGIYKVTPALYNCDTEAWRDIYVNLNQRNVYVKVEDNQFSLLDSTPVEDLKAINIIYPEAVFNKRDFSASADIVNPNNNEFAAGIKVGICSKEEDGTYKPISTNDMNTTFIKLAPGETRSVTLNYKDEYYDIREDRYICFLQYYKENWQRPWVVIGEPIKIPLTEYVPGTLVLDSISIDHEPTESNPTLTLNSVFHCEDGYYNGEIYMDLVECDENGVPLDPIENPTPNRLGSFDGYAPDNNNENNDKKPQSPPLTIGRKPHPTKISRKQEQHIKEWNKNTNYPTRPRKYYTVAHSYRGGDDDQWLTILSTYMLAAWAFGELGGGGGSTDVPLIPEEVDMTDQTTYYNLNGNVISGKPTTPGIYIKKYDNGSGKTEKVIIY